MDLFALLSVLVNDDGIAIKKPHLKVGLSVRAPKETNLELFINDLKSLSLLFDRLIPM
jgi:hypothetical protein